MSSVLEINCLVFGDDPSHIFPIEIDKNESVGTLKNVIKEKRPLFDSVPADTLVLWNVSIPIDHLKDNVQEIDLVDETPLLPVKGLSEVFSKPPTRKHLHIVVKSPFFAQPTIQPKETKGEDIVAAVIARYNDTVAKARGMKTPSETAKSTEFRIYQQGLSKYDYYSRNPIETTGPPIQLFHPVFAYFLDDLANELTVPPEVFLRTVRYMQAASGLYDTQEDRWHAIEPPLRDILGGISRVYNSDGTSPNGLIQISLNGEYNHLRNNTCCPIFLLANAGSWFGVLGAVFTDKVIVQRLTDFIGVAVATVLNENHYERVAHVLYALRRNVDKLRGYYAGLELTPLSHNDVHPPFCPSIRAYRDHDKQVVEFRYLRPLGLDSTCATFLAKTLGDLPRFIVVKFVQCYGADAHRILAKENFAPQLLYYGKAGVR